MGTGLADWDNVEEATGEELSGLMASWGSQLFVSGLGLYDHPRMNYRFAQIQTTAGRGFALPAQWNYALGGDAVDGFLPPRGVDFIRVNGSGPAIVDVTVDPNAEAGVVVVELPQDRMLSVWMPADYLPGLDFGELMPGAPLLGRNYTVSGDVQSAEIGELLFQYAGDDTLTFQPTVADGAFSQQLRFERLGIYNLETFSRARAGDDWEFIGAFGPIRVVTKPKPTAVVEEVAGVLPLEFALGLAYPNPFNGRSAIPVFVPELGGPVAVAVYNVLGQQVHQLHQGRLPAGWNRLSWDGTDQCGAGVASGIYVYRLSAGDFVASRSLLFLK